MALSSASSSGEEEFNPNEAYLRRLRNIIDDSSDEDINILIKEYSKFRNTFCEYC